MITLIISISNVASNNYSLRLEHDPAHPDHLRPTDSGVFSALNLEACQTNQQTLRYSSKNALIDPLAPDRPPFQPER